jgi:uncharacterized repeat protein (TIGR02543 family)
LAAETTLTAATLPSAAVLSRLRAATLPQALAAADTVTAAVFLHNGKGPDVGDVTCVGGHTLFSSINYASSLYGITLPEDWFGATSIGAYLRLIPLTYDANEGTGTVPDSQVQHIGTTGTVQAESGLSHTGYIFDGWNTQENGNGTDYEPVDSFIFNADTTLYAIWTANDYTIIYDAENGTVPGGAASTDVTYDSTDALLVPTRAGYTFGG